MRAWTIFATLLLGVSACSTGRTSVAAPTASAGGTPCGSSIATVNNHGPDDAEAYVWRGGKVLLGIVPHGSTREYLTTERGVLAGSASGGSTYRRSGRTGVTNKNIVIRVECADKA